MWPFSKIRHLEHMLKIFRELDAEQSKKIEELRATRDRMAKALQQYGEDYRTRGEIVESLRKDNFRLTDIITRQDKALKAITDHGTAQPNATVQRLVRTAEAALSQRNLDSKPVSSPAEEWVKSA